MSDGRWPTDPIEARERIVRYLARRDRWVDVETGYAAAYDAFLRWQPLDPARAREIIREEIEAMARARDSEVWP